jgi:hypothetical protein
MQREFANCYPGVSFELHGRLLRRRENGTIPAANFQCRPSHGIRRGSRPSATAAPSPAAASRSRRRRRQGAPARLGVHVKGIKGWYPSFKTCSLTAMIVCIVEHV